MSSKILVLGACGQLGSELTVRLREIYGKENIITSDIKPKSEATLEDVHYEQLDATDFEAVKDVVVKNNVSQVYQLVAMLSATGEKFPEKAWHLNMTSLFVVLDLAKEGYINKVFWPSSIAVFGETTPKVNTPQNTITEPSTVYGLSKLAGERWCAYYHKNYGVDVRSVRYPGLLSWKTRPGGGTTDYAIDMFFDALSKGEYTCFLKKDTILPMMYMNDAVKATIDLMNANSDSLSVRSSYNVGAFSFSPDDLAKIINQYVTKFKITYQPDFRQNIAETWPESIDDNVARQDWNWQPEFNLNTMAQDMINNLQKSHVIG